MGACKRILNAETIDMAEVELQTIKDSLVCIKLKAIIAAGNHTMANVADIFQVSTVSIYQWIKSYMQHGLAGLRDHPKGHMRSKLNNDHRKEIRQWIVQSTTSQGQHVIWTLDKLRQEINVVFNITIGKTPLWKQLKKMNLVLRRPRPVHYKADPAAQEKFKKKRGKP